MITLIITIKTAMTMKQSVEGNSIQTLKWFDLEHIYGGKIVRVEYFENGVRKIKYVEI